MIAEVSVTVTRRAAEKLGEFAAQGHVGSSFALRLDVVGGAPSGLAYDIYFDQTQREDLVFESEGIVLIVRSNCLSLLSGSTIDWVEGNNGAGFLIRNPNFPSG